MSQLQVQAPKHIELPQIGRRYTQPVSLYPGYQELSDPVWYDHESKTFYFGDGEDSEHFNKYWPLWDLGRLKEVQDRVKSAGVPPSDPYKVALAGVSNELYPSALALTDYLNELKREKVKGSWNLRVKNAAILKREDFTSLKTILPQAKIIAAKPRRHALLDMFTIDNTSDFLQKLYTWDGPYDMITENLAELNIPQPHGFPSFTPQTIGMQRYAAHYAFSEEFLSETFDFNIKQFVIDNVAIQMEIVFNKKVADVLNNSSTYTAYGDWTARTGQYNTREPAPDINAEAEKIWLTERNEDLKVASNRKTFNAYLSNTYNSAYGTPTYKEVTYSFGNGIFNNIAHFPDLEWGVDTFMAAQKLAVFDPSALYIGRMPQRVVDYTTQFQTHRGTLIRQNFVTQIIDQTRMVGASGLTP